MFYNVYIKEATAQTTGAGINFTNMRKSENFLRPDCGKV